MYLAKLMVSLLLAHSLGAYDLQENVLIQRYMAASTLCGKAGLPVDDKALEDVFHENYQAFLIHEDGTEEHIVTSREAFKERIKGFKAQAPWTVELLFVGPSKCGAYCYVEFLWCVAGKTPLLICAHVYSTDGKQIEKIVETATPWPFPVDPTES